MEALTLVDAWPVGTAAAGLVTGVGGVKTRGPIGQSFRWASITKLATALAVMVAVEEGTIGLDAPAGPPGATVRHLLSHASGLPFEGSVPIARPEQRRIYSNSGFEVLAEVLEAESGLPFDVYLAEAVLQPVGLPGTRLEGTAAAGLVGPLTDLLTFSQELLRPTLVAPSTFASMTTVTFPGLAGILPGVGRFDRNDWGLGFELRDDKSPHWTGRHNSAETYGHFGGSGAFVWVDPKAEVACASLSDREFGPWALEVWPALSDAVLREAGF